MFTVTVSNKKVVSYLQHSAELCKEETKLVMSFQSRTSDSIRGFVRLSVDLSVCRSVCQSARRSRVLEFKPKSDLTSINAPAQRLRLIRSCIQTCQTYQILLSPILTDIKGPTILICYKQISVIPRMKKINFSRDLSTQHSLEADFLYRQVHQSGIHCRAQSTCQVRSLFPSEPTSQV